MGFLNCPMVYFITDQLFLPAVPTTTAGRQEDSEDGQSTEDEGFYPWIETKRCILIFGDF